MSQAKTKADARWLLAAAGKAAEDGDYITALQIVGQAAQALGELIVAGVEGKGRQRG